MSIWNRGNWMQTISYTGMGKLRNWTGHNKTLQIVSKEGQMKEDVLPEPGDWDQTTTIRLCWTWRHKGGRAHSQELPWRPRGWKKNVLIHLFLLLPNPSSAKGSGRQLTQQPGQQDLQGSDAHLHSGAGWGKGEKGTPRANVPSQTPEDSVSSWLLKVQPSFRPRSQTVQVSFPFPLSSHRTFLSWDPDCQKCRWGRSVIRLWHTHPLPFLLQGPAHLVFWGGQKERKLDKHFFTHLATAVILSRLAVTTSLANSGHWYLLCAGILMLVSPLEDLWAQAQLPSVMST